jgi:plastocyanin
LIAGEKMRSSLSRGLVLLVAAGLALPGRATLAADPPPPTAADFARLQAELARVQQELRDQRQLIFQLMQMHDSLLKFVSSGAGGGAALPPSSASLGEVAAPGAGAPVAPAASAGPAATEPSIGVAAGGGLGSISGRIHASGDIGDAYVYLDGPKSVPARPPTVEIKQRAKQFVPAVTVVPVGTRVLFPNEDKIFHNVFSSTPGDAFDLGTVKAGDKSSPVTLLKPGHVEVFCNIHSKMRADILVVPNVHWTRVRPDGSFEIKGVPVGARRVVLWGPGLKPVSQRVDVTASGTSTTFTAESSATKPHLNKQGGAYGSYDD